MTGRVCEPLPGPPCTSAAKRSLERASAVLEAARRDLASAPDDGDLRELVRRAALAERERRLIWESTPGGQRHLLRALAAVPRPSASSLDEVRERIAAGRRRRVEQRLALLRVEGEDDKAAAASVETMLARLRHDRRIVAASGCPSQLVGFFLECHPETTRWTDAGAGRGDLAEYTEAGPPCAGPYVAILRRESSSCRLAWWRRVDTLASARAAADRFHVAEIWDPQAGDDLRVPVGARSRGGSAPPELDDAADMVRRCAATSPATATAATDLAHWRRRLAERYSA